MSNYLITGGRGCIGSHVIDHLIEHLTSEDRIIILDNDYNANIKNLSGAEKSGREKNVKLEYIHGDIKDQSVLYNIFFYDRVDYVFHMASMLTLDTKYYRLRGINNNTVGFCNILEMCAMFNTKKLVFASSASVYGNPEITPTTEDVYFKNSKSLYAATKIANEYFANYYADDEGLKIVGLRPFNVYGPRQTNKNFYVQIIPKLIQKIRDNENVIGGQQTMDFIHASDVGRFFVEAMNKEDVNRGNVIYKPDSLGGLYTVEKINFDGYINLGSGVSTSVNELFFLIKKIMKDEFDIESTSKLVEDKEFEDNYSHVKVRQSSTSLRKLLLGEPKISLYQGLTETIQSFLPAKN